MPIQHRPHQDRRRHAASGDDGSMLLFFLVAMVVGALLSVMLANSVMASKTARHDANFTQAFPGADKNVALAQSYLNTAQTGSLVTTPPSPAGATGWYVTANGPLNYTVQSWNTVNGLKRTVTAQLS